MREQNILKYILKGYKLCFSHKTNNSVYGHANIIKYVKSNVQGALWNITKKDEEILDGYEGVITIIIKKYISI